jgi:polyisoprenoid-binding protein YceI
MLSTAVLFVLAVGFAFTLTQGWKLKDSYSVKFSSKDVNGIFRTFSGTISFDEANLASSKFDLTVDVNSINTGNGLQNKHAKGEEWFNADKYPNIKFTSSRIEKSGSAYKASGTLEMRGVKKDFTVPFSFKKNGKEGTFSASFNVNRTDFKVGKSDGKVAETIKVDVSLPVTKK